MFYAEICQLVVPQNFLESIWQRASW